MSRRRIFLPFGPWLPDRSVFEFGVLREARNMLPIHGHWRPMRRTQILTSLAEDGYGKPIAAYCHVWRPDNPAQNLHPDASIPSTPAVGSTRAVDADEVIEVLEKTEIDDAEYVVTAADPSSWSSTFSLQNPTETVGTGSSVEIHFRYRLFGPALETSLAFLLKEGLTTRATATVWSAEADKEDEGWINGSYTLDAGEVSSISDYDDLSIEWQATREGAAQDGEPIADVSLGGWRDQDNFAASLFEKIIDADDDTYIRSQALTLTDESPDYDACKVLMQFDAGDGEVMTPMKSPWVGQSYSATLRLRTTNLCTVTVRMYSVEDLLKEKEIDLGYLADWTDTAFAMVDAEDMVEFDKVNWNAIQIEVEAKYREGTSENSAVSRPDSLVSSSGWTGDIVAKLADDDDGEAIVTNQVSASLVVDLGAYDVDADTGAERVLRVRVANAASVARNVTVSVLENAQVVASKVHSIPSGSSLTNYDWNIESVEGITALEGMRVRVEAVGGQAADGDPADDDITISRLQLRLRAATRVEVAELTFDLPSPAGVGLSWLKLKVPAADSDSAVLNDDHPIIVVGAEGGVVAFHDDAWDDLGATTLSPYGWDFCSWGELVIGTNFIDPVKKWDPTGGVGSANLETAITSGDAPKARFCAVVRDQLFLANINFSGSPVGYADEVWAGPIDDISDFTPSIENGCFRQRLRQAPGGITGLVGGDVAMVWKRGAIIQADYLGPPYWYGFRVLSRSVGTDQPKSIVRVGDDYYFKGTEGGFWRISPGGRPVEVSEGVNRYFFDSRFSEKSLAEVSSDRQWELDGRIFGAHDPASGLIVWCYRRRDEEAFVNAGFVIYNPKENRFAFADADDFYEEEFFDSGIWSGRMT